MIYLYILVMAAGACLAAKVLGREHEFLVEMISDMAEGRKIYGFFS